MSSDPLFSLLLWSSVSTVPLFHCSHWSSGLTVLFHCPHCSSGLTVLFHCPNCSSGPLSVLFHCPHCSSGLTVLISAYLLTSSCLWTEADQHSSFRQQIVRLAADHLALSPVCHMCHQAPVRLRGTKLNRN